MLPVSVCAQLACIWEATARKPGNVHRFCDFADTNYVDFLASAAAIGPAMETARQHGVGQTVLDAILATRSVTSANTNLGIVLLLAPLAAADGDLRIGVRHVLRGLGMEDARHVYSAIRLASPGGLGDAPDQDVRDEPTLGLREAMALAVDRDGVARQYANDFHDVFDVGLSSLTRGLERTASLEGAIIFCHLSTMVALPDTLIARKRGPVVARKAVELARAVLDLGWPDARAVAALKHLDDWLRMDGNARNPGTTADLVTATLFVALRTGALTPPLPWPAHSSSAGSMSSGNGSSSSPGTST